IASGTRRVTLTQGSDLAVFVQVLQGFYVQATHPRRPDALSGGEAFALIATWLRYSRAERDREIGARSGNNVTKVADLLLGRGCHVSRSDAWTYPDHD
ncbi:MAG: hypothetical protein ACOCZB_09550, partial [Spirochaetota bacterium]